MFIPKSVSDLTFNNIQQAQVLLLIRSLWMPKAAFNLSYQAVPILILIEVNMLNEMVHCYHG